MCAHFDVQGKPGLPQQLGLHHPQHLAYTPLAGTRLSIRKTSCLLSCIYCLHLPTSLPCAPECTPSRSPPQDLLEPDIDCSLDDDQKLDEELGKFREEKARRREETRASRPWSAPAAPGPQRQRQRMEEDAAMAAEAEESKWPACMHSAGFQKWVLLTVLGKLSG